MSMGNDSLFALAAEFAFARRERELALQSRLDEYCKKDPELLAARARMARARVRAARAAMNGQTENGREEEEFETLLREKLLSRGEDPERFTLRYYCPICKDTGVVGEDSQVFCSCLRSRYADLLREKGKVDPRARFENWDSRLFRDEPDASGHSEREYMDRLRRFLENWCEEFTVGKSRGLRLIGVTGCGKTFALNCAANALCDRGLSAVVTRAYDLNRMAASTYSADWQKPYLACDFLVIDDLGAEPMYRKITAELFFSLVESRRCEGKPTGIATNLTDEEFETRYGSRLYSRLIDRNSTLSFTLHSHDLRRDSK